jgi:hypothetical protein
MSLSPDLKSKLGLDRLAYEGLHHRAQVPALLRDMVKRGCVEVTLTMSAKTALRMADDLQFAINEHPLGVPGSKP